jgi:predicted DNA-binding transcriptional regulator AlpA
MSLKQIRAEKIDRSRSWIFNEIRNGRFPKPIGGCIPNLWDEADIDRFVEDFVAKAKEREGAGAQRVAKATSKLRGEK